MEIGGRDEVDGRVALMVAEAVLAGAYSELIRRVPETEAGFEKLRRRHSDCVTALAEEIAKAGPCRVSLLAMPGRLER